MTPAAIDGCGLAVMLAAAVALLAAIAVATARDRAAFEELCRRIASRIQGACVEGGPPELQKISFRILDREASLELRLEGELSGRSSVVRVDVRGISPGFLMIAPDGFGERFLKLFGDGDFTVGDPEFDEAYAVRATSEPLVRRLFAPAHRRRAIKSIWSIHRFHKPSIDLNRERLIVQVRERLSEERDVLALIETARTWMDILLEGEPATGITWMGKTASPDGECQVCGSRLAENVVHCASCRTPHHRDCWDYAGECSTYACREKRFA